MDQEYLCYVCGKPAATSTTKLFIRTVKCDRCGEYAIPLELFPPEDKSNSYILSGVLRRAFEAGHPLQLSEKSIPELIKSAIYPQNLLELIDEYLLLIYNRTKSADDRIDFYPEKDYPLIFCKSDNEFRFVHAKTLALGFVDRIADSPITVRLNVSGWQRVKLLMENAASISKIAFMAMPFGDPILDRVYNDYLVPTIGQTGFRLKRLDEHQPAGLIDSRLRVEIRNSRFLLAELTHNNNGVYWEAGYAEGLGKPVIYLSKKEPEKNITTHFDTNHHTTVFWHDDIIQEAMEVLKDVIRATLPAEAKMTDD